MFRILMTSMFLCALGAVTPGEAAALGPEQIHLTWQGDTKTTMTVQWATGATTTTGVLEYGLEAGKYTDRITARKIEYPGASRRFWAADATGLQPGTLYHYRVGDDAGAVSPDLTFQTAPEDAAPRFRFIAFGDSRGDYRLFGRAMEAMRKEDAQFFVFSGDATMQGKEQEWDAWFKAGEDTMRLVPFMPTYGNHDALADNYFERFELPKNIPEEDDAEQYYSFSYGNAKFIFLNDNYIFALRPSRLDGPQYTWLENELKNATEQWIFVVNHQPFYSSSNKHGSEANLQRVWAPLFDRYHVNMVFNGHDHNYERSFPLNKGSVQSSMDDGTVYVVAAGVGAPLYGNGRNYWTALSESVENYVVIEIDGPKLTYTAKRLSGTVLETFEYVAPERKPAADAAPEAEASRGILNGPLWHCSTAGASPLALLWLLLPLLARRLISRA